MGIWLTPLPFPCPHGLWMPPVLRKVGEKTPPGTLRKSKDRPTSSCKSWCEQYSQTFLAKTIDTPLPDPGPYADENDIDSVQID